MSAEPHKQRRFGATAAAFVLLAVGWLPMIPARIEHSHPHEYMVLDFVVPMLWLGACSLAGGGCALYAVDRAETGGRPMAVPLILAMLSLPGIFVPLWWFF